MLYCVKVKDRKFHISADSEIDAVYKLQAVLRDDRLSPMTYRKLKELGYDRNKWKNLTQEQANKIVSSNNNSTKNKHSTVANKTTINNKKRELIDNFNKIQSSKEAQYIAQRVKNHEYFTIEELKNSNYLKKMDKAIDDYDKVWEKSGIESTAEFIKEKEDIFNTLMTRGSYSGKDENGKDKYDGPIKKQRKAVIAIGLPASGKSSAIVNKVSPELGAYVIDSDEAKFQFREFKQSNGLAANSLHEHSQEIINSVFAEKLKDGTNVVIPVIGSSLDKLFRKWINALNDNGYDIEIKYKPADSTESINRVVRRSIVNNRPIDSKIVFDYEDKPSQVYEQLKGMKGKNGKPYIRE